MYYNDKNKIWYAGGGFKKSNGYLPYHNGFNQNQTDLEYQSCYVDYAPTCCLLVKSEVFIEIGLMDEKYFVYFDDTDFMYRIKKNKKNILFYDSHYCIFHKVGSLTKSIPHDKENNFIDWNEGIRKLHNSKDGKNNIVITPANFIKIF